MQKRSIKGMLLAAVVVLGLGITATGCDLVSVNPEKDRQQVMATVDGTDITKNAYNNAMAYVELYYAASDQSLPTGTDLQTMKEGIFDSVVQNQVFAAKAKKDGTTVDEAAAKKEGKASYDSVKTEADKKYAGILADNYTTDELFAAYMEDNAVISAYADKVLTAYEDKLTKNPEEYLKTSVGTIDGEDLTRGEYNYYYVGQTLSTYMTTGAALETDDKTMKTTNETIFNQVGLNRQLIKYCEDNGIEITDEAIASAQTTLKSTTSMFFQDDTTLGSFLESYNLTAAKYKEYQKEEAKANAAEDAIKAKLGEDITVSDAKIKKYFDKNKDTYDTSTVSACHILTQNQDLANEIYDKAKNCAAKADFEKVMAEYKTNGEVTEATDLGAFNKSKMAEAFAKAAFSMDVNTVSKPVQSDYGYHVIFVYDKADSETNWEDYKDEITQTIVDEESETAYTKLTDKLSGSVKTDIGDIKTATEQYEDELKTELNVTVNDKLI